MRPTHLLASSTRTDLVGRDLWLDTVTSDPDAPWAPPRLGFAGRLYAGHRTDVIDPCLATLIVDGEEAALTPVRHTWTPAGCHTVYRVERGDRREQATLAERTWIAGDALCAEWTYHHTGAAPVEVEVRLHGAVAEAGLTGRPLRVTTTTWSLFAEFHVDLLVALAAPRAVCPPHVATRLRFACGLGRNAQAAASAREAGLRTSAAAAEAAFDAWFGEHVPRLRTDDLHLLRLYTYRWFVVYRALHRPDHWYDGHPMPGTLIYEGPVGIWFSAPIGLPLPLQIRELRWMRRPEGVAETLAAWMESQGALRMYASDPVSAALIYDAHHPGELDLDRLYTAARAYLEGGEARSPRIVGGGLERFPVTVGSWVTGTEFAPDFFARTTPPWDHLTSEDTGLAPGLPRAGEPERPGHEQLGRLLRVDTDTWHAGIVRSAALLAVRSASRAAEIEQLHAAADRLMALLSDTHGGADGIFRSVDARSGERIDEVVNFEAAFPFLLDDWEERHRLGLLDLLSERHLLAPYGLTSTSQRCPAFSAENRWEVGPGASADEPFAYPCAWNGPSWHYATSWVLLALGRVAASTGDAALRDRFTVIWERWCEAHCYRGDPSLPLVMEHYHPYTGAAYRVIPDYFHSAWLDLFFRHIVGLNDEDGWLRVDPLVDAGDFTIEGIPWHGRRLDIRLTGGGSERRAAVTVDGAPLAMSSGAAPWRWAEPP